MVLQLRFETKRRIVRVAIGAFLIWPIVHFSLVRLYGADPWRLGGWGMYVVPQLDTFVQARELDGDRESLISPDSLADSSLALLMAYQHRWEALGRLATPDAVARDLLGGRPGVEGVVIATRRWRFQAELAMFSQEDVRYLYRRKPDGSVEVGIQTAEYPVRGISP